MNKEGKQQLAEMQLLMERMDSHMTGREVEMRKAMINEDLGIGRRDMNSFDELINEIDLGRSFVGLAYIQAYEASKVYPEKNGFKNSLNTEIGKLDPNSRLGKKMNGFLQHPEFANPTGRGYTFDKTQGVIKSMASLPFAGVVKITNYVFNWGNAENYGNFLEKYRLKKLDLRNKFGFGKDDADYASDDWRRKVDEKGNPIYGGIGLNPQSNDNRKGFVSSFHQLLHPDVSLYGDTDTDGNPRYTTRPDGSQYQKRVIKMGLSDVKKQWSDYLLVDENGEVDAVEKSLSALFSKPSAPTDLLKKITAQMSQDEQDYIRGLQAINDEEFYSTKTWYEDNVLYIVGNGKSRITGEKTAFRWVNKNLVLDKININPNEIQPIIDAEIKRTFTEIQ